MIPEYILIFINKLLYNFVVNILLSAILHIEQFKHMIV